MFSIVEELSPEGHLIAEAESLASTEAAVEVLLSEGYERLIVLSPTGAYIEEAWIDSDCRVIWQESGLRAGFLRLDAIKGAR